MVSFRDQKKLGPRLDRSPLFKISDEHPHPFHMRIPPRIITLEIKNFWVIVPILPLDDARNLYQFED